MRPPCVKVAMTAGATTRNTLEVAEDGRRNLRTGICTKRRGGELARCVRTHPERRKSRSQRISHTPADNLADAGAVGLAVGFCAHLASRHAAV